jgi:TolB-like protein
MIGRTISAGKIAMSLFAELKRRNVLRVAAAYVVAAWLVIQVVETIFPAFGFSDAAVRIIVIVFIIGLLPVLILAWAFELTPEGLKLDKDVDHRQTIAARTGRKLDRIIMVVLALALGYFAIDKFVLTPQHEASRQEQQAEQLEAATRQAREAGRTEAVVESFGERSIAVLPFSDLSPGRDQAHFADGISEELLNLLASVNDLRVISRSSSFALRDDGLSVPEIAKKLNVTYVLEGSVRKSGETVRITAQLVDARSDTHLWSETFDRSLSDVFAVQDEISVQVVDALKIELLGAAPTSGQTSSVAYELYLEGLGVLAAREDIPHAIELFEQVVAIDETYAPAFASLALALIWSDEDYRTRNPRLEAAVSRALVLNPGSSDALTALGQLRVEQNRLDEGRELLEQAIANNPNNAFAHRWLGNSYSEADPVRYYALSRKAYELNPLDPTIHFHLAQAASMLGRYGDALEAARRLPPGTGEMMAGNIHHQSGSLGKSLKSFYQAYRTSGDFGPLPRELMMMKEYDLVEAWLREGSGVTGQAMATLAAIRGEPEEAFRQWARLAQGDAALADWTLGVGSIRFTRDLWLPLIDYALALQRTGSAERAAQLMIEISAFLETRIATGVVGDRFDLNLQFWLSALHAMSGDTEKAIVALRNAALQGVVTCTQCVRMWPHWDSLRDETEFNLVLDDVEADKEVQRQRLADEGMLLNPTEVLQLEEFSFDPFLE